jgi:hypothetical protein
MNMSPASLPALLATYFGPGFLHGLLFDSEDGGDMSPAPLPSLFATSVGFGFLLGLFFDSEDGGDIFFRNVR